jgi:hypothetical protein
VLDCRGPGPLFAARADQARAGGCDHVIRQVLRIFHGVESPEEIDLTDAEPF